MLGDLSSKEQYGILPNSISHIFDYISERGGTATQFLVRASFYELYNEEIRDLLTPGQKKLEIKEDPNGVYVKDGSSFIVQNGDELMKLVDLGNSRRAVAATAMNATSSRSHSIFIITVEMSVPVDGTTESHIKVGKLHLVDLAGSERQAKTMATGDRLKEAAKINLSLSCLGNVIAALVDGKSSHIPYRDSKLTRLLQDSLGGNSKTCMLAAISPASYNLEETLSTLRYAQRTKQIKNQPKVNEDPKDALLREYQEEIDKLRQMLEQQGTGDGAALQLPGTTASQNLHQMTEQQLSDLQSQIDKEKNDAATTEDILERNRILSDVQQRSEELERERKEREALGKRLEQMQSKLLSGGENLIVKAEEQERNLKQHSDAIAEQVRKQEELKRTLEEREDQYFHMQQSFSSLKEELNDKVGKLKQLWGVSMRVKEEITDIEEENTRERDSLLDNIRDLVIDLKLKTTLLEAFVPPVYLQWIEANAKYDEDERTWFIPKEQLTGKLLKARHPDLKRVRPRISEEKDEFIRELEHENVMFAENLLSYAAFTEKPPAITRLAAEDVSDSGDLNLSVGSKDGKPKSRKVSANLKEPPLPQQAVDNIPMPRGLVNKKKHYA